MARAFAFAAFVLFLSAPFAAASEPDPAPPERHTILLPNGERDEYVRLNDVNYRVIRVEALASKDISEQYVYVEAKVEAPLAPDRLKLIGASIAVVIENPAALKQLKTFTPGSNVWLCGAIRKSKDAAAPQLFAVALQKLPGDLERWNQEITAIKAKLGGANLVRNDRLALSDRLIDLAQRIDGDLHKNRDFIDFAAFAATRDKAYDLGLTNKELALERGDAAGLFELAEQWNDYRHSKPEYHRLAIKCLKLDPDHPGASKVAQEMGLVKYAHAWISRDEAARLDQSKAADLKHLEELKQLQAEAFHREQEHEAAERPARLNRIKLALCTHDPKLRDGALASLGREIDQSIDPEFGVQSVGILANLEDPAVYPGLTAAGKSRWPEVRREAYEALAWRSRFDADREPALGALTAALKAETDAPTARAAVEAAIASGKKPALGALVASLTTSADPVRDEIVTGLRHATRQSLASNDEWENWWRNNRD